MAKACCNSTFVNPFTRSHYDKLKDAERRITDLATAIDKIENCGAPCEAFREVAAQLLERFGQLEKEYMSPTPKR